VSDEACARAAVEHHRSCAEIVKARDTAQERRLDGAPNGISVPRWSRGERVRRPTDCSLNDVVKTPSEGKPFMDTPSFADGAAMEIEWMMIVSPSRVPGESGGFFQRST
jgi:hypothetical protein